MSTSTKASALRELTVDELKQEIVKHRKELFEATFKHSLQQLDDTSVLRNHKRSVARIHTILNEKQTKA